MSNARSQPKINRKHPPSVLNVMKNNLVIIVLAILFVIVMMIPITALIISPEDPDPLNTPISELGNRSLNQLFASDDSIVGVGKNLFDGEFEVGTISSTTGINAPSGTSRRSVNFIKIKPNTAYILKHFNAQRGFGYFWYDSNYNFISGTTFGSPESWSQTSPSNASYMRLTIPIVTEPSFIVQLELGTIATTYESYKSTENLDDWYMINWFNLDLYGLESLSNNELNFWYQVYLSYL